MSDLEQILNGEQPEPEVVEAETQAAEPESADASEQQPEAPTDAPKVEPKAEEHMVPQAVVAELRAEIRALKAQQQPQAAPKAAPDVFDDPAGYASHMQEAVKASVTGTKLEMSRFMAEREFGKEAVDAAYEYFNQHPEQSQELLNHPSPFHAAVETFNRQRVASEIGSDPDAWMAKQREELRKEIEAELVAKQVKEAAARAAPSMANVTGTGGGPKANWTGPTSLSAAVGE